MDGYAALGIFFLMALGFPIAPIIIANIIQPKQPTDEKDIPFTGVPARPFSPNRQQTRIVKCFIILISYYALVIVYFTSFHLGGSLPSKWRTKKSLRLCSPKASPMV